MDYEKIFNIVTIFIVFILSVTIIICFFRGRSYRRGSDRTDERDSRIQKGFDESKRTSGELAESVKSAGNHLDRAESILQGAIDRSRKEKESVQDSNDSNRK